MTALWIELTRHHAALDPHFALRPGADAEARRLLEAQLRDPDTAIFVAGRSERRLRIRDRLRAPRAADPPRDVPRRDHRSLRRARAAGAADAAARSWLPRRAWRASAAPSASRCTSRRATPRRRRSGAPQGYGAHMEVLHRRL